MKIKLSLLLLLATVFVLQAQDSTYRFSLQQAIDYAYKNQVNVKNAIFDEKIAKQKVNEFTGLGTPQISGEASLTKYIEIPTTFLPDFITPLTYADLYQEHLITETRYNEIKDAPVRFFPVKFGQEFTSSIGVSASQLLFDGSYLAGLKGSKIYLELSRKQTQQTKIETNIAVTKAYYNVLVNNVRLQLVNANETRLKKLSDDTKAMFDNGVVEKLDFDRASLAYNNILVQKQNTERLIALSYLLLKFQMGMDINANIQLSDSLDENKWTDPSIPDQVDYNKRIEYDLLQTTQHLQQIDLKRYRSQYLPSLAAFGSFSTNASRDEFNIFNSDYRWYPTSFIGLKLSVPLWDGLQKNSRVQQSKLGLYKVNNSIENLKQGVSLEYATAKANLQNNIADLENSKKNRDIAMEIVRATKIKYDNGIGSSLEVANAETTLKESETNYFNALYETIIAKLNVDKALGNIK